MCKCVLACVSVCKCVLVCDSVCVCVRLERRRPGKQVRKGKAMEPSAEDSSQQSLSNARTQTLTPTLQVEYREDNQVILIQKMP